MMMNIIFIALAAVMFLLALIIIIIIVIASRKNKNKEPEASILDVNDIGVNDNREFSYGYEKEATIVMEPVDPNKASEENIEDSKTEVFVEETKKED